MDSALADSELSGPCGFQITVTSSKFTSDMLYLTHFILFLPARGFLRPFSGLLLASPSLSGFYLLARAEAKNMRFVEEVRMLRAGDLESQA